jgi:hypothetical protein
LAFSTDTTTSVSDDLSGSSVRTYSLQPYVVVRIVEP